jgi:rhomboid protease GluP
VFRRFLTGVGFTPRVTFAVLGVLIAMHIGTGLWDVGHHRSGWLGFVLGERSDPTLVAWGARTRWALRKHQAWRLVSYGALHGGALHLFMNGLALVGLGRMTEAVFGGARFLLILLLSVLAGGCLSQWGGVPVSVGVSGGVFGLMGALVAYGRWHRAALPPPLRELFGRRLYPWVALNLLLGLPMAGIVDNYAHIGGLCAGAALGPWLADHILDNRRPDRSGTAAVWAINVALLGWATVGLVWR